MNEQLTSPRKPRKQKKSKGSVEKEGKDLSPKAGVSQQQKGSPDRSPSRDQHPAKNKQGEADSPANVPEAADSRDVLTPLSYIARDHASPSAIVSPTPPPCQKPQRSWKHMTALLALVAVVLACAAVASWAFLMWISASRIELNVPSYGTLHGLFLRVEGKGVYEFLGIRFAENTSGSNRFKLPVATKSLRGTLDAVDPKPGCDGATEEVDDCLHLNIWTPCTRATESDCRKAVVLFLFGIDFYRGNNNWYDGRYFSALGDIVLVVPNFRLGFFGLFSSGTPDAPGNLLLYDQTIALKWIVEHIEYFGGNASNIVVMGSATGAWSLGVHLLSTDPYWRKEISRIILHSESPFRRYIEKVPGNLGSLVECPDAPTEATASCLRDSLAGTILQALVPPNVVLGPLYNSSLVPKAPWELARTAVVNGKDVLLGAVSTESCALVTDAKRHYHGNASVVTSIDIANSVLNAYGIFNTTALLRLFKVDRRDMTHLYTVLDNVLHLCPVRSFGRYLASQQQNRVRGFFFDHRPSYSTFYECPGAARFQELDFLFGFPIRNSSAVTPEETRLSRRMIEVWSQFAKTGNLPNMDDNSTWPVHTTKRAPYVLIGPEKLRAVESLEQTHCYEARTFFPEVYGWLKEEP